MDKLNEALSKHASATLGTYRDVDFDHPSSVISRDLRERISEKNRLSTKGKMKLENQRLNRDKKPPLKPANKLKPLKPIEPIKPKLPKKI